LTNNNQENNVNDRMSPTYASSISSVTTPFGNDQLAELNLNLTNVSSTNNEIPPQENTIHLVDDQPSPSTVRSSKQSLVSSELPSAELPELPSLQTTDKEGEKNGCPLPIFYTPWSMP
jgi:hypothetical protein